MCDIAMHHKFVVFAQIKQNKPICAHRFGQSCVSMDLYDYNAPGQENVVPCCSAWMGGVWRLQD